MGSPDSGSKARRPGRIRLRSDLSDADQEQLKYYSWKQDGDALEFIHQEEDASRFIHDPEKFLDSVRAAELSAGSDGHAWGSLHYHVSRKGADLKPMAEALNHLMLVRRLNEGIISDLTGTGKWGFNPNIMSRGLLRLHNSDELEIRSHRGSLREELRELLGWLSQDPAQAAGRIQELTRRAMTSGTLDLILKHDPTFAEHLMYYLPDGEKQRVHRALLASLDQPNLAKRVKTYRTLSRLGFLTSEPQKRFVQDSLFQDKDAVEFLLHEWPNFLDGMPAGRRAFIQRRLARNLSPDPAHSELTRISAEILLKLPEVHPEALRHIRSYVGQLTAVNKPLPIRTPLFFRLVAAAKVMNPAILKRALYEVGRKNDYIKSNTLEQMRAHPEHASVTASPEIQAMAEKYLRMHSPRFSSELPGFILDQFRQHPQLVLDAGAAELSIHAPNEGEARYAAIERSLADILRSRHWGGLHPERS